MYSYWPWYWAEDRHIGLIYHLFIMLLNLLLARFEITKSLLFGHVLYWFLIEIKTFFHSYKTLSKQIKEMFESMSGIELVIGIQLTRPYGF